MPESLYALALLACPVVMGVMMWTMNRGHRSQPEDVKAKRDELAGLEAQIGRLRAEQGGLRPARAPGTEQTVRSEP